MMRSPKAFSLVELLMTISVIAVIGSMAIPVMGPIVQAAGAAKGKRNAQNIVSVYNSAVASGLSTDSVETVEDAIQIVATGTNVVSPSGRVFQFSVDGLTDADVQEAGQFLELKGGQLVLLADGNF